MLQESLYGYHNTSSTTDEPDLSPRAIEIPDMDPDLAMALRISEQEQKDRQDELRREQEMFEQALKLSLEECIGSVCAPDEKRGS